MPYARDNIIRLDPYTPGEQPRQGELIKLNTNENPYPTLPAVLEAVATVTAEVLRRYPSPLADDFRATAAAVHGLSPNMVIATNGGDELLRLAVTVFCEPRSTAPPGAPAGHGGLGVTDPTYSLYQTLARIGDTNVTRVALNEDWSLPADLAERMCQAGCRLVLLVSPHAPCGIGRNIDQIASIAARLQGRAVLLIDEAYVDFADADALALLDASSGLDNVLILRTLSKGYSLAGLRFGYGLGHRDLIAALDKARDSYNTNAVSQAAAVAALRHREDAAHTWRAVRDERTRMDQALRDRGHGVVPSESNFLLTRPPAEGPAAADVYRSLKQQGILVRYFDKDRLRDKLRITIGTPPQNDALLAALDRIYNQR